MGALRSAFPVYRPQGPGQREAAESPRPAAPSRAVGSRGECKGAGQYSTDWGQPVDTCPTPDRSGRKVRCRKGSSSTKGTSGSADRGPLRGGSREAALAPVATARAAGAGGTAPRERVVRRTRESGLARWARHGRSCANTCAQRRRPLQPVIATSSRHEVSEPIGSGRSFRCEQSRRKAPGGRKPPGPWPVKPRLARSARDGATR